VYALENGVDQTFFVRVLVVVVVPSYARAMTRSFVERGTQMMAFVDFQYLSWVSMVSPPAGASMLHVVVQPSSWVVAVVAVVVVNYLDFLPIVAWMLRVVGEPEKAVDHLEYQPDGPMTELVAVDLVVMADLCRTMVVFSWHGVLVQLLAQLVAGHPWIVHALEEYDFVVVVLVVVTLLLHHHQNYFEQHHELVEYYWMVYAMEVLDSRCGVTVVLSSAVLQTK
jgi:hypothetical protein